MLEFEIKQLIPRYLQHDKNCSALAKAIEAGFKAADEIITAGTALMDETDPDSLPEWRVDEILDSYNLLPANETNLTVRRDLIKHLWMILQRTGTAEAVRYYINACSPSAYLADSLFNTGTILMTEDGTALKDAEDLQKDISKVTPLHWSTRAVTGQTVGLTVMTWLDRKQASFMPTFTPTDNFRRVMAALPGYYYKLANLQMQVKQNDSWAQATAYGETEYPHYWTDADTTVPVTGCRFLVGGATAAEKELEGVVSVDGSYYLDWIQHYNSEDYTAPSMNMETLDLSGFILSLSKMTGETSIESPYMVVTDEDGNTYTCTVVTKISVIKGGLYAYRWRFWTNTVDYGTAIVDYSVYNKSGVLLFKGAPTEESKRYWPTVKGNYCTFDLYVGVRSDNVNAGKLGEFILGVDKVG